MEWALFFSIWFSFSGIVAFLAAFFGVGIERDMALNSVIEGRILLRQASFFDRLGYFFFRLFLHALSWAFNLTVAILFFVVLLVKYFLTKG